jgi:hypothetical protein
MSGVVMITQNPKSVVALRILLSSPLPCFVIYILSRSGAQQYAGGWTGSVTDLATGEYLWFAIALMTGLLLGVSLLIQQVAKPLDAPIWTRSNILEGASLLVSSWAAFLTYSSYSLGITIAFSMSMTLSFGMACFLTSKAMRAIKVYQGKRLPTFVFSFAHRTGYFTAFSACLSLYVWSGLMRVPIPNSLLALFSELSLKGVTCTDSDALMKAIEVGMKANEASANTTCHTLPNCGYTTFEHLCQAVQYAPMVEAVGQDLCDVILFMFIWWAFVSLILFGTGRARAEDGYSHLFTRHMIVFMGVISAQSILTLYAALRILVSVPQLHQPRPASFFAQTDTMFWELPLTCYSNKHQIHHAGPLFGQSCTVLKGALRVFLYWVAAAAINIDFLAAFASRLLRSTDAEQELVQQAIDELKKHELREERWEDDAPFLYFLPAEWVRQCNTIALPRMQSLRDVKILKKFKIPLVDALRGEGIINRILFVSHRWEVPEQPDVEGEQLAVIKAYLHAHLDIEWVWFDFSTMPQGENRTPYEKAEFSLMLTAITDFYLTARVLILLDGSYASRFWTLTEAWCSMQTATPMGLRPATENEHRYTIECIHNAVFETSGKGLIDLVSTKTPDDMYAILAKPDVNVTNAKDKVAMLPKIKQINEHVVESFTSTHQHRRQQSRPRPL